LLRGYSDLAIVGQLRGCDHVKFRIGELLAGLDRRDRDPAEDRQARTVRAVIGCEDQSTRSAGASRRCNQDYAFRNRIDRLDAIKLSADRAVPLGLVVNEFATNSLKHAVGPAGGTISLKIERLNDDRIQVIIADDGCGLPTAPMSRSPRAGHRHEAYRWIGAATSS